MPSSSQVDQDIDDYAVKVSGQRWGFIRFENTFESATDSVTFLELGPWGRHRSPVDDPAIATAGLVAIPVLVMLLTLWGVRKWWGRSAA